MYSDILLLTLSNTIRKVNLLSENYLFHMYTRKNLNINIYIYSLGRTIYKLLKFLEHMVKPDRLIPNSPETFFHFRDCPFLIKNGS